MAEIQRGVDLLTNITEKFGTIASLGSAGPKRANNVIRNVLSFLQLCFSQGKFSYKLWPFMVARWLPICSRLNTAIQRNPQVKIPKLSLMLWLGLSVHHWTNLCMWSWIMYPTYEWEGRVNYTGSTWSMKKNRVTWKKKEVIYYRKKEIGSSRQK